MGEKMVTRPWTSAAARSALARAGPPPLAGARKAVTQTQRKVVSARGNAKEQIFCKKLLDGEAALNVQATQNSGRCVSEFDHQRDPGATSKFTHWLWFGDLWVPGRWAAWIQCMTKFLSAYTLRYVTGVSDPMG